MEEFLKLKWGISGPHELDIGPDFLPEEEISSSYVFSDMFQDKLIQNLVENTSTIEKKELVPGQQYKFKCSTKSCLDTKEQAKCLNGMRLLRSGNTKFGFYERICMELYNNCLPNILEENTKFVEFAKSDFLKSQKRKKTFKFKFQFLKEYATSLWKSRLRRCKDYKQLYKGIDMLPYSYNETEESAEMLQVQNILELGTLARFLRPTLLKTYHLKQGYIPKTKIIYNSKQSVSKDENIDRLVETTPVDVVISSSGLTKLLNFTKINASWDIPIVVKECKIRNKDGTVGTKNVIFIDKPLPNKSPSVFELNEQCVKILLKTNFCDTEAFSFPNTEIPIDNYQISAQTQRKQKTLSPTETEKSKNETEVTAMDLSDTESSSNEDAEASMNIHKRNVQNEIGTKTLTISETEKRSNEVEETLVSHSDKRQLTSSEVEGSSKKNKFNNGQGKGNYHQTHHNVSYRLWKLQLKKEQCELMKTKYQLNSIQVLIRSKLDGCESLENGLLQPITVLPKLEYNLEYGAGIPTKDELVKEWTTAFFRPCSQVRRIRTHYSSGEIISIENCNVQKIAFEAQTHYQLNMNLGLGILYKIFSRLTNLTPGDYLLRHLPKDTTFVTLLRETTVNEDGVYNLHDEYDEEKCKINTNAVKTWHPIDANFILPIHNVMQQMPGMFDPRLPRPYINGKSRGRNRRKKKRKEGGPIVKQAIKLQK